MEIHPFLQYFDAVPVLAAFTGGDYSDKQSPHSLFENSAGFTSIDGLGHSNPVTLCLCSPDLDRSNISCKHSDEPSNRNHAQQLAFGAYLGNTVHRTPDAVLLCAGRYSASLENRFGSVMPTNIPREINRGNNNAALVLFLAAGLLSSVFFPTPALGKGLLQFAMFSTADMMQDQCRLVERASPKKEESPIIFEGYINDYSCNVSIPKDKYNRFFQFCYQSGMNVTGNPRVDSFECFIQERDDDYLFLAHIAQETGNDGQIMCYFSCIPR